MNPSRMRPRPAQKQAERGRRLSASREAPTFLANKDPCSCCMFPPGAKRPLSASPTPCWPALPATAASTCRRRGLRLTATPIAGLAGLRYADVARRRSSGRFSTARSTRRRSRAMVDDAYATFRHPAVCPLVQIGDNLFVLELFHGPTLAFKDVAMQLLGRLMDHVLEERGPARHHRGRDLRRHRRRGDRGVPRPEARRHVHPLPAGPRQRGAAPADDHRRGRQRPRDRGGRRLRRLPGAREGHVQPPRLPRRDAACPASTRSTGRGSWRRSSITSRPR